MNTRSISSKFNLENNKCKKVFSVDFGDVKGTVDYDLDGDVYILNDSYIPDEVRGKGYGHLLAKVNFSLTSSKIIYFVFNVSSHYF